MAVKKKNGFVQSDEILRKPGAEIGRKFVSSENETPGRVVILTHKDTPGNVAIIRKNQGRPTSCKKAGARLIFPGEAAGDGAERKSKKIEKNFKKGIAFF